MTMKLASLRNYTSYANKMGLMIPLLILKKG